MAKGNTKLAPGLEPEPVYTYDEIAALAKVTDRQVKRWVEEGWIGFIQLPRGRRISRQHYLDYLARNNHEPEA